ncbi:EscU/YscU/HrcU family type III secretion system export apparatus switch protein [Pontivivens insulae]|uniref:Flagellar biosynthetic protein FlhB n=1 Tax=Pontivivens insulae TaxID=1639689 RepID=A0A2R8A9I6_9RHOB|nr:flagellar type III secretion system protein FlhB [Pontivivens insulae]RED12775.1 flagellar biosynthetic protein FlhB [Pontivivens insulae]SPF28866.1 Flagellar biosynthetic protein FlhB [Pontivivens insulae]
MSGGEQESSGEKSHDPTDRRLQTARDEGNIERSPDVDAFLAYLGLTLTLALFGDSLVDGFGIALRAFISSPDQMMELAHAGSALGVGLSALTPFFAVPALIVLAGLVARRGIAISAKAILPKLSRIDPVQGAGQKFGATGLFNFAKSTVKLIVVSVAVSVYLIGQIDLIAGLARAERSAVVVVLGQIIVDILIIVTAISFAIAVLDYLWQRFDHRRKLRMTHQELRDETKEGEGDPHIKGQRRQRAQDIAGNQMLTDMQDADVVMVNPTDFAVALKWDRDGGGAPVCVAKGQGEMAARIRDIAAEHGIPLHRDVPATRALFASTKLGEEVPEDLYRAVAAAIRFADTIRAVSRSS